MNCGRAHAPMKQAITAITHPLMNRPTRLKSCPTPLWNPPSYPRITGLLSAAIYSLAFSRIFTDGIVQYELSFSLIWLLSHSIILRFMHVSTWINSSFLFIAEYCLYHNLFIHSSVDGHLGYFRFGTITIKLLWTFMHKSLYNICFHLSWVNI